MNSPRLAFPRSECASRLTFPRGLGQKGERLLSQAIDQVKWQPASFIFEKIWGFPALGVGLPAIGALEKGGGGGERRGGRRGRQGALAGVGRDGPSVSGSLTAAAADFSRRWGPSLRGSEGPRGEGASH